ncbi:TIGR01906 family membrane protein [Mediterraneibacter sp. ICN-202921]|uniref:TIGR01906 family membrane protein n=1 Tax=Mediterraneibacter sp. ICN-202921 TaxID=3134657 RepID=UPI0030BC92AD
MNKDTRKRDWLLGILFSFSLITAVLISSFEIAMYADFGFYQKEYEKYKVLPELDMEMDDVMHVTREMMAYLRGDRETLEVYTTVEGKEQDFFNEQDRFHMAEVKELFLGGLRIRWIAFGTMAVSLVLLFFTKAKRKTLLCRSYQIVLAVSGGLACILGIAAAIDFNAVFVKFHHIFFDNDLWLFDPTEDYMIRMLPEGLFADMLGRIGILFGGGLLFLLAVSIICMRKRKN